MRPAQPDPAATARSRLWRFCQPSTWGLRKAIAARASSAFGDCLYQIEFGHEMLLVQGNAEGAEETVTPQQEGSVIRGKAEWNRQSAARFANINVQRMYGCLDDALSTRDARYGQ